MVEAARAGDVQAFRELVERHAAFICSLAYGLSGNQRESEEIRQEALVIAWRRLPRLQKPESFRAWLWGITRNVTRKFKRTRVERWSEDPFDGDVAAHAPDQSSPLDGLIEREDQAAVARALQRIPESYRVPLVLHYWEQWSVKEVADALNLREDNVKQRLARGRRLMQGRLAPPDDHPLRRKRSHARIIAAVTGSLLAPTSADADPGARAP